MKNMFSFFSLPKILAELGLLFVVCIFPWQVSIMSEKYCLLAVQYAKLFRSRIGTSEIHFEKKKIRATVLFFLHDVHCSTAAITFFVAMLKNDG